MAELKGVVFDLQGTLCLGTLHHTDYVMRPNTREGLEALRDEGIDLGLFSAMQESDAHTMLTRLGLEGIFEIDFVLGGDSKRTLEIVTETSMRAKGWLGKIGVREIVTQTCVDERKIRQKPSPDAVNYMLKTWQLSPAEAVYVGDSAVDQLSARNAQVAFVDANCVSFAQDFSNLIMRIKLAHQAR